MPIPIGEDIGRISDVKPVAEIIKEIVEGYEQITKRMAAMV